MTRWLGLLIAALAWGAAAQQHEAPNGVLLVAKPGLADPNFRETVVLVHQTADSSTVGVILNRPSKMRLSQFLSDLPTDGYTDALYFGGPVMRQAIVALFRAERRPAAPAFPVLKDVYLSMHPGNIEPLLAAPGPRYRLYAGFSGWAPRQLESEIKRDGWYVLPAREELLFRTDTSGMWRELLEKARGARADRKDFTGGQERRRPVSARNVY